jgi:two-component system alkaline phosphatase synthesis response regulator PhoP
MKKILCADDEPFNLEIVEEYLEGLYQVDTVENGEDCIAYLKENTPDLVLLDHLMPELDGLEVCKIIRLDQKTKHVPVIIASGNSSQQDIDSAKEAGADDYLTKPFEEEQLIEVIKKYI